MFTVSPQVGMCLPPSRPSGSIVRWLDTPYHLSPQATLLDFAMDQKKEELRRRGPVRGRE